MSVSAACPNCAWAIEVARERKLPSSVRIIFITIAERVDRYSLSWNGTIGAIEDDTGLSRRTIQYLLPTIPKDLMEIVMVGCRYTFRVLRNVAPRATTAPPAPPESASIAPFEPPIPKTTAQPLHPESASFASLEPKKDATTAQSPLSKNTPKNPSTTRAPERTREKIAKKEIDLWFDAFWQLYPRKEDKGRAYRTYLKAIAATGNDPEDILDALDVSLSDDHRFKSRENGQDYRPLPSSWLNAGPWHSPGYLANKTYLPTTDSLPLMEAANAR